MITKLWLEIRNWLLIRLAHNHTVILNASLDGKKGIVLAGEKALIANTSSKNFDVAISVESKKS